MNNQAPFLDIKSFVVDELSQETIETSTPSITPFLPIYEALDGENFIDPETEEYTVFLNELYDEEMDDALSNLVYEATAVYETHFSHEQETSQRNGYEAERLLEQHFAPLAFEAETMFEALASEFSPRDPRTLTEEEIETIVDRYQPAVELAPNFEDFFGKLKKAFKKVAKTAVSVAKKGISVATKLGLGPILNKLKGLIKPLLKRVIKTAIGKLPQSLQPIARKLARRHPLLREIGEDTMSAAEMADTSEIAEIQYEFNQRIANLLFAPSEVEQDLELAQAVNEQQVSDSNPLADLDRAREQFIQNLLSLQEGEDPEPYVEEFIPAILPALKIGIKLAGRKRVVKFLAKFLSKLIRRFVGRRYAPALSRAIVDAGLRLISLEVSAEDEQRAAGSAVAATVEETMRRIAALPEYILDDQELLEGFALEAFEYSAGENLPQMLAEETYRQRPGLGKGRKFRGVWITRPGRGRKRYKKFSRKIPTRITPRKVAHLETFEGLTLEEFLEEQHGVAPGEEVDGVMHLFESIPGTRLADIARLDEDTPGFGAADGYMPLHPLSRDAAALFLDEPEMGRDGNAQNALDPHATTEGQRFYYLELPAKRPLTIPGRAGRAKMRRPSRVRVILDFPKNEMRLYLFLSEIRAQEIAVKLRQRGHIGAVTVRLQKIVKRGLQSAFKGSFGRIKIVHEAVTPDQWVGALRRLPQPVLKMFMGQVTQWVTKALAGHLKQHPELFIKAAEDTADGVTLLITISSPPGFPQLRQALKGKGQTLSGLKMDGMPPVKIKVSPGYTRE
jgi:hypothetical protein